MIKVYEENNMDELKKYPLEVIKYIDETIGILNQNYGINRDIEKDLGGYIFIAENIVDIEILKYYRVKGVAPEYTDIIECKEGVNWTSSLFLLSSDYAIDIIECSEGVNWTSSLFLISSDYRIVVVTTEELSKLLLE